MRLSISETAVLTKVSVRTLHYYDEIGLLKPSDVTEAGYRYYDDEALMTLQQILFYRELDFPLKEIKYILNSPGYDRNDALMRHRELIEMKQRRLSGLLALIDNTLKGERAMNFEAFDMKEIEDAKEKYSREAKERWGDTQAYKESIKRTESYGKEEWNVIQEEMHRIWKAFADSMEKAPADDSVQVLVEDWKKLLTKNFYPCTIEILAGLGDMYTSDERFRKSMDCYREGTAEYMGRAIRIYCDRAVSQGI